MICSAIFFAMLKKSEAFISLLLLPRRWVVLESQADRDKWHSCQFWDLSNCNSAACLHQVPSMQAKIILGKRKDRTSGIIVYLPWCKDLVDAQGPTILYGDSFSCAHSFCRFFDSVGFLQGPTSYSYKVWALTCWGEFRGGYVYMYRYTSRNI